MTVGGVGNLFQGLGGCRFEVEDSAGLAEKPPRVEPQIAWLGALGIHFGVCKGVVPVDHSRDSSYPWSPFPPRRARPGPGPHIQQDLLRNRHELNHRLPGGGVGA